jgi:NAD(P)H-quinone oxidoreductase subunit 5
MFYFVKLLRAFKDDPRRQARRPGSIKAMNGFESLALLGPVAALSVGCVGPLLLRLSPERCAVWASRAAGIALTLVLIAIVGWALDGGGNRPLLGLGQMPGGSSWLLFRLDSVGAVMLATVSLIGAIVARFARRYLDRDPAQRAFSIWLSYTLAAILVLPMASNLLVLFGTWIMASHGLHQLLTLYPERPAALLAARKKFLISRLGDLMLALAFGWIIVEWGSLDFETIFSSAAADSAVGRHGSIFGISTLVILGAITKSAQFPFHSWLPDTMEAPTPVSALMHAGIINAGGFLLIRMSPLLSLAPGALLLLAFIGAISATGASLAMLTQNDVKRKLAFSTISQMGFMMLQCGLGAFSAAMLHIVGHSFYKAHAFLSAGSWVDPTGSSAEKAAKARPTSWPGLALALATGFGLAGAAAWVTGIEVSAKPGGWVLVSILALALAQGVVIWASIPDVAPLRPRNILWVVLAGGGLALSYLLGVALMDTILAGAIARPRLVSSDPTSAAGLGLLLLFLAALLMQTLKPRKSDRAIWAQVYLWLRNGFYWGDIQNGWVQKIWTGIAPKNERPA